ncbi:Protein bfr2 [Penicillium capsulatum]|uniref:Protein BFR2 n=1 Tax=Penicillium capsulatum TaxID=69766 RepID=A0A9W9I885_9EURO|nr:Protein bfr2 [Penicillium capsulatum]KAJ6136265.1 Protein bfr2 [Penicillium capsulatum]
MAPGKKNPGRSLADQLADLEDPTPKDFDPEDLDRDGDSSDEDKGKQSESNAGREHYQAVGKGKLRKQDPVSLGKQYAGTHVSRDSLAADSEDDPFAAHSDDDMSSEDTGSDEDQTQDGASSDDSDSPQLKQRSRLHNPQVAKRSQREAVGRGAGPAPRETSDTAIDAVDSEDEGSVRSSNTPSSGIVSSGMAEDTDASEGNEDEDDEGEDEEDEADEDDEDDDDSGDDANAENKSSNDREELRRLMATDQKTIASTISQAAKADAAKGKAVKIQRTTFDCLLNTRIKLQKGLSAVNELTAGEKSGEELDSGEGSGDDESADAAAIKSAETAAFTLWSTLEELRTALADAHAKDGKKRKRPSPITSAISTTSLWERMADLETESLAHRRAILDKWSSKVRGTPSALPNARGKLLGSSGQQNITAVLDAHVATEIGDCSSKRLRQNNSTGSSNTADHEPVYDDTVFYQSLLRDLVEQRMSSDAMTGGLENLHQLPSRLPIHPITGMRNDKVKRDVDTRASKGRKMRFNVHEKLQNFMAPEDRGAWTNRARDEFFASLLGKTASGLLGEGDESASDDEDDNDREEGGLRLFRS